MKRLLLIALTAGLAVAAQAQPPVSTSATADAADSPVNATTTTEATTPVAQADENPTAATHPTDAQCLRATGSRIAKRDGKSRCIAQPGRAYSREDIERTGQTNVYDALRTLDSAVN